MRVKTKRSRFIKLREQCGATGIINLADDAVIGKDGVNVSGGTYMNFNVHAKPAGYAYVASIAKRVLTNYYNANPLAPSTVTSSTYAMAGTDRFLTLDSTSNAIAVTLPDCIGMGNSDIPYSFRTKGSAAITLTPASISGQTETVEGSTSAFSLTPGTPYRFKVFGTATATAAPGGCDWQRVP